MAESSIVKNFRDGTIQVVNGTRTYTVSLENGNLKVAGYEEGEYQTARIEDRGDFSQRRRTSRKYVSGSFSAYFRDLVDGTNVTLPGILLRRGVCASDTTKSAIGTEVYTVDIRLTINGTSLGDPSDHVAYMTECRCVVDLEEGDDKDMISVSFEIDGFSTFT